MDEVVIGVRFEQLSGFADAHAGIFWNSIRDEYPTIESHGRLETPPLNMKRLSETPPDKPDLPFEIEVHSDSDTRTGRTWLISADQDHLIQIQDTIFFHNWRRRGGPYPHLDAIEERFWSELASFREFLADIGIEQTPFTQLELTYFNWIPEVDAQNFLIPAETLIPPSELPGLSADALNLVASYLDRGEGDPDSPPIGRLRVELQPAFRTEDGTAGYRFVLSYKSPLASTNTQEQLASLIQRGRRVIDYTFTETVTQKARETWGKL